VNRTRSSPCRRTPAGEEEGASNGKTFHGEELVLIHPSAQHGFYDPFFAECSKAGARPRPVQYANDIQTKMW